MQAEVLSTPKGIHLNGPLLLSPQVFSDERGFFFESWNQRRWQDVLADHGQEAVPFLQDNHSRSARGVIRGLHYQISPQPQGKLVRCVVGEIFDVAVDLRRNSSTYGEWISAYLTAENNQMLWIPVGFGHGFKTLSNRSEVLYKSTDFWDRACERSILWSDPRLDISWPVVQQSGNNCQPIISEKDSLAPLFSDLPLSEAFS